MTYWSDVVQKLWEVEAVKSFTARYSGSLSEAFKKYKDCSLKATKKCDRIVFGERFLRSTILYWLLLPLVVLFALPVMVILFVTGFLRLIVRTLVYIGISIKCMLSTLWMAIEVLIIYLAVSCLWWFFTCRKPVTIDLFVSACHRIYDAIIYIGTVAWNGLLWYMQLIIPCWLTVGTWSRGTYLLATSVGFGIFFIGGIIALIALLEDADNLAMLLGFASIAGLIVMAVFGLMFMGTPDRVITASKISGYCDRDDDCAIDLSDGLQYYGTRDVFDDLTPGNHTIGVIDETHRVCQSADASGWNGCNKIITVREILWVRAI